VVCNETGLMLVCFALVEQSKLLEPSAVMNLKVSESGVMNTKSVTFTVYLRLTRDKNLVF
jgi:hypothetical protein